MVHSESILVNFQYLIVRCSKQVENYYQIDTNQHKILFWSKLVFSTQKGVKKGILIIPQFLPGMP